MSSIRATTTGDRFRDFWHSLRSGNPIEAIGSIFPDEQTELPDLPEPEEYSVLDTQLDKLRKDEANKKRAKIEFERGEADRRSRQAVDDPLEELLETLGDIASVPGAAVNKLGAAATGDSDFDRANILLPKKGVPVEEIAESAAKEGNLLPARAHGALRGIGGAVTDPANILIPAAGAKAAAIIAGSQTLKIPKTLEDVDKLRESDPAKAASQEAELLTGILAPLAIGVASSKPSFSRDTKDVKVTSRKYKLNENLDNLDNPPVSLGSAGGGMSEPNLGAVPVDTNFQFNPGRHTDLPNWVLRRETAPLKAAVIAHRDFADLESLTAVPSNESIKASGAYLQSLDKLQTPELIQAEAGKLQVILDFDGKNIPKLAERLDKTSRLAKQAGVESRRDFSLFEDDPKVVADTYKKLNLDFDSSKVVQDYAAGIKAGLTPKYTRINDLVEHLIRKDEIDISDAKLFNAAKDAGLIRQKRRVASSDVDYEYLDPNISPLTGYKDKSTGIVVQRPWAAHPEFKKAYENYLKDPENNLLSKTASASSTLKEMRLSAGVMGHNTQTRRAAVAHAFASSYNPLSKEFRNASGLSLKAIVNPRWAQEQVVNRPKRVIQAARAGVRFSDDPNFLKMMRGKDYEKVNTTMLSHEQWKKAAAAIRKARSNYDAKATGGKAKRLVGRNIETIKAFSKEWFEDPTHQAVIPLIKIDAWESWTNRLVNDGVPPVEAQKLAAQQVNELMSGLNYKAMLRDKRNQQFWQALLLAPDHYESQGRLAAGTARAFYDPKDPRGRTYRTAAANVMGTLATMQVLNYMLNGHSTWDNGPGKELSVEIGKDSKGRTMFYRPFGNFTDMYRIPIGIIHSIEREKNPSRVSSDLRARESGLAGLATSLASNTNWKGQRIFRKGPETWGPNVLKLSEDYLAPQWLSAPLDFALGEQSLEESLAQLAEEGLQTTKPKGRHKH